MSKLRKVSPCKQLVAKTFNENSNLITITEDDLNKAIGAIRHGDSAAKAANFLISQLPDVKYNILEENLDPRGVYKGISNGKKAIKHLGYLRRNFNLSKEIKRDLDYAITCTDEFFKVSRSRLRELKKEADNYVSPEEKRELNKNKDLLLDLAEEFHICELFYQLEELLTSVWIRVIPIIQEFKKDIGTRAFEKSIFGSKGKLCFEFIAKHPCNFISYSNLKLLLEKLPIHLLAKLFRGFSLTINEDLTVTIFCQGRENHYKQYDQREYEHPYDGNPLFSDEDNLWFEVNRRKPSLISERSSWQNKREEILSKYSDEVLFPSPKKDYFEISFKDKETKEL